MISPSSSSRGKLTMRLFDRYGRFGNQLLLYAFLKTYARRHELELELPRWTGTTLFGLSEPAPSVQLPAYRERYGRGPTPSHYPLVPDEDALVNRDFRGYGQYHTSYLAPDREWVLDLVRPVAAVAERLEPALSRLRGMGKTCVGLHFRAGDYGRCHFFLVPPAWYRRWLEQHWKTLDEPVLFVATQDGAILEELKDFRPVTAPDLGLELSRTPLPEFSYLPRDIALGTAHEMDFYPDHFLLSQCDVLIGPNSTFSFSAALLSRTVQRYFRADLVRQFFVEEEPWWTVPLLRDRIEDLPPVPGTSLESNPYWGVPPPPPNLLVRAWRKAGRVCRRLNKVEEADEK